MADAHHVDLGVARRGGADACHGVGEIEHQRLGRQTLNVAKHRHEQRHISRRVEEPAWAAVFGIVHDAVLLAQLVIHLPALLPVNGHGNHHKVSARQKRRSIGRGLDGHARAPFLVDALGQAPDLLQPLAVEVAQRQRRALEFLGTHDRAQIGQPETGAACADDHDFGIPHGNSSSGLSAQDFGYCFKVPHRRAVGHGVPR